MSQSRSRRTLAVAVVAAALTSSAESAAAEGPGHRLTWSDDWPRFRVVEYGMTAALLLELAFLEFRAKPQDEAVWKGGILFDGGFRDAFRSESRGTRETLGDIADFLTLSLQVQPVLIDAVAIPLIDRFNVDVAWQMSMLNLSAMGFVGVVTRIGHIAIARERPSVEECRADGGYDKYCGRGNFASFPSGHTSGAFLGAGLMCAHHLHLPLYGGGAPDVAACLLPLAAAGSTSVFRLMSDRHYATDIGLGAVIGFFGGYGLPQLLHYGQRARTGERPAGSRTAEGGARAARRSPGRWLRVAAAPLATDDRLGVTVLGLF